MAHTPLRRRHRWQDCLQGWSGSERIQGTRTGQLAARERQIVGEQIVNLIWVASAGAWLSRSAHQGPGRWLPELCVLRNSTLEQAKGEAFPTPHGACRLLPG